MADPAGPGAATPATPDAWRPEQYARFAAERRMPWSDLLALLEPSGVLGGPRVIDLGCGTGELTRDLHARAGARETVGLDRSPAMLAKAGAAELPPGLTFRQGDLAALEPDGAWDIVLSNAALQWVDDHPALLARLRGALRPRGQLAVQMPANHDHASHRVADEVAQEAPFAAALGGWRRRSPVLSPARYAELLAALGFPHQHVRLQVYVHRLADRDEVVEWVKGTLLTAYEERLAPDLFQAFVGRYRAALAAQLQDDRPYVYAFPRLLLWARLD